MQERSSGLTLQEGGFPEDDDEGRSEVSKQVYLSLAAAFRQSGRW